MNKKRHSIFRYVPLDYIEITTKGEKLNTNNKKIINKNTNITINFFFSPKIIITISLCIYFIGLKASDFIKNKNVIHHKRSESITKTIKNKNNTTITNIQTEEELIISIQANQNLIDPD